MSKLNNRIDDTNARMCNLEQNMDYYEQKLRMLSYKSIDLEARSRRNNLIFYGITENTRKDCKRQILGFLEHELEIDTPQIVIKLAHRLGPQRQLDNDQGLDDQKRPIIVHFLDCSDTEIILENSFRLKHTRFKVDRDYPTELDKARKELYQSGQAQEARKQKFKV